MPCRTSSQGHHTNGIARQSLHPREQIRPAVVSRRRSIFDAAPRKLSSRFRVPLRGSLLIPLDPVSLGLRDAIPLDEQSTERELRVSVPGFGGLLIPPRRF